jgi:hypothetical protein
MALRMLSASVGTSRGPATEDSNFASALASPSLFMRLLPGLTCLVYPALVWSISGLSAFTLPLTLIPLLASMAAIFRTSPLRSYPWAVAMAHLGVAAPALYNVMGAWLDFQKTFPFHGNTVWVVLWSALLVVVALERPVPQTSPVASPSILRAAHGISAAAITLFALFHIANHLAGVAGGEAHLALMKAFRTVYRNAVVEGVLGVAVLFQFVSGIVLLRRRLMTSDRFEMLQGAAGAYLLMFFVSHLRAVLRARYVRHIDTNWIWLTSSNLLTDAWSARLVPYYFLGIVALGLHGACGLRFVLLQHRRESFAMIAFWVLTCGTVVVALLVMTGLVIGSLH